MGRWLLDRRLLPAFLAAALTVTAWGADNTSRLVQVKECDHSSEPRRICLDLGFSSGQPASTLVSCRAYDKPMTMDELDFQPHDLTAFSIQICNMSLPCRVDLLNSIQPGFTYYTFCWQIASVHPFDCVVQPQCQDRAEACGLEVKTESMSGPDLHSRFGGLDLSCILLLAIYVSWNYVLPHVWFIHETAMAALTGLFVGAGFYYWGGVTPTFNYDFFSFALLPLVIFAAGFNLQHKNFFRYIKLITALGVLGTVMIFFFVFMGSSMLRFRSSNGKLLFLNTRHRVIMASVLASTDSVAPIAFLPAETFPRLYAVVFGEGVLNDVVSILLSTAATKTAELPKVVDLIKQIFLLFSTSAAMGVCIGLAISFVFTRVRVLQEGTIKPAALLVLVNYLCYVTAELCDFSSIFALFVCALVSGHYARHSMNKHTQQFVQELAEFMSYLSEAFVFGYFGLTAITYCSDPSSFSLGLIIFYSLCILIARFTAVGLLSLILRARCRGRHVSRAGQEVPPKEIVVIALAGCMRGTIAYALVLKGTPPKEAQRPEDTLLITTVLGIVLVNCLVFGAMFPVVLQLLSIASGPDPQEVAPPEGDAARSKCHQCWHKIDMCYLKPLLRAGFVRPPATCPEATRELVECEDGTS